MGCFRAAVFIMASYNKTAILNDNTVVILGRYTGLDAPPRL
jgi:hypothetical protein